MQLVKPYGKFLTSFDLLGFCCCYCCCCSFWCCCCCGSTCFTASRGSNKGSPKRVYSPVQKLQPQCKQAAIAAATSFYSCLALCVCVCVVAGTLVLNFTFKILPTVQNCRQLAWLGLAAAHWFCGMLQVAAARAVAIRPSWGSGKQLCGQLSVWLAWHVRSWHQVPRIEFCPAMGISVLDY